MEPRSSRKVPSLEEGALWVKDGSSVGFGCEEKFS